ncbi:hypothetical protein OQA88_4129 [Cercophora sp. LCS_1]
MKWTLAISFFSAAVVASPIIPAPDAFAYKLKLVSRHSELDGRILSVDNNVVGVHKSRTAKPLEVYAVADKKTGLVELRTYPRSSQESLLALIGENGLFDANILPNPAGIQFLPGTTVDWQFRLGGRDGAGGRAENSVTYEGKKGGWAAYPRGENADWVLTFKSPEAWTTQDYIDVQVVYEPLDDDIYTIQ